MASKQPQPLPDCRAVHWYTIISDLVKLQETPDHDLTKAWEYVQADDFDGAQREVERIHLGPPSQVW